MLQKVGCYVWWDFSLQEDCSWQGYRGIWFRMAAYHSIIWKHSGVDNTREMCLAKVETANKQQLTNEWGSAVCTHKNYPMEKHVLHKIFSQWQTPRNHETKKQRLDFIFNLVVLLNDTKCCFHSFLLNSVLQLDTLLFSTFSSTVQSFLLIFCPLSKSSSEEKINFLRTLTILASSFCRYY